MPRMHGVDLTRGLAVLGMFTAHLAPGSGDDPWPRGAVEIADGRSAATFVVLAGLSIALLSGGSRPVEGIRRVQARTRILVRGALLLALGVGLIVLGTPVQVILPAYGVYFALSVTVLGWSARRLLLAAGAIALVGPPLTFLTADWLMLHERYTDLTNLAVGPAYPAGIWTAYVLAGLGIGRLDLRSRTVRLTLLAVGAALAGTAHGVSTFAVRWADDPTGMTADRYLTTRPHSGTTLEVVANTGVALGLLALCLLVADRWPRAVAPIAATGALSLTAYTVHIIAIAALGDQVVWVPSTAIWLAFLVVTVTSCTLWRTWLGRGPLERLLHLASSRAADISPDEAPQQPERAAPLTTSAHR